MTRQPQRGRGREIPPVPPAPRRQVFYLDAQLSTPGIQGPPVPGAPAPVPGVAAPVTGASASLSPYISPQGVPLSPGGHPNHLPPDSWPQAGFSPHPHLAQPGGPGAYQHVSALPARPRNRLAADFAEFKRNPLIITAWVLIIISPFVYILILYQLPRILYAEGEDFGPAGLFIFAGAYLFIYLSVLVVYFSISVCAAIPLLAARSRGNLFAAVALGYVLFPLHSFLTVMVYSPMGVIG